VGIGPPQSTTDTRLASEPASENVETLFDWALTTNR